MVSCSFLPPAKSLLKYIAVGLVIFTGIRCQNNKQQPTTNDRKPEGAFTDSLTLVETETIYFPIDTATNYNTLYLTTHASPQTGQRFLVYQCDNKNSIQFYDFDKRYLVKEIRFSKFGPNGIPRITGFYVFTPDSLLVLSAHQRRLYLVNGQARVLNTYNLLKGDESSETTMALFTTGNEPFLVDDTFYMHAFPDRSPYYRGKHIQAVNLQNGRYAYAGNYPGIYEKKGGWETMFTSVGKYYNPESKLLYSSHTGTRYLYYGPVGHDLQYKAYAGSKFFDDILPLSAEDNKKGASYIYLTQNYYHQVLYDPYRQLYYRVAFLAVDPLNDQNEKNNLQDKPMSIIILNKNLKKVGETLLPPNRYYYRTLFVEKEGLYIAATHYRNPELREDRLAYALLVPQPLQK